MTVTCHEDLFILVLIAISFYFLLKFTVNVHVW